MGNYSNRGATQYYFSQIPAGTWDIYSTELVCCQVHRPYSQVCDRSTRSPTQKPVAALTFDDQFQIIPLKFTISGLPQDDDRMNPRDLKDEMLIILKRILTRLMGKISSLKVKSVEENLVPPKHDAPPPREPYMHIMMLWLFVTSDMNSDL